MAPRTRRRGSQDDSPEDNENTRATSSTSAVDRPKDSEGGQTPEPKVRTGPTKLDADERDPELGALTVPDEGQFDEERTTAFDWLGNPPELWWDQDKVIGRADRPFHRRVRELLATDGRGGAVEAALTMPIRQATPKIDAPDDDAGQTEFVEEVLFAPVEAGGMRTPFAQFIGQVANAMLERRSFHEKVWTKREDGRTVYKKLAWRPPESCEVWRDPRSAEILGFRQYQYLGKDGKPMDWAKGGEDPFDQDDPAYRTVHRPYAFIYTHGQHRDPINGISDLDVSLWAHDLKMKVVQLWIAFLDGMATPRVAIYGKDKTEVDKRARAMAMLRSGGVVGFIRSGSDENVFDTIESAGTAGQVFQDMIRWLDNVASESIMAGHLGLTGGASEGRGSLALSKDSSGLYLASRDGAAKEIADTITADIIAPLVALNFGAGTSVPRFTFESTDTSKMAQVFEMFNTFAVAGSLQVPAEFVLVLMESVAQYLDMPVDKVAEMIEAQEESIKKGREAAAKMNDATMTGEVAPRDFHERTPPGDEEDPRSPAGRQALTDKVDAVGKVVKAGPPR